MSKPNLEFLRESSEQRLEQLTSEVDKLYSVNQKIEKTNLLFTEIDLNSDIIGFKNLINYRLFLGIVSMDLCSAILISTKASSNYENIYSARQIIVIINEAYKKIYNFTSENEKGDVITKYRNRSYWIQEIGSIIKSDLPELQQDYNEITKKLDDYLQVNFSLLKYQRDLSIHYDKNPVKVYKMLIDLNVEEAYKKLIPFIDIINKMFIFTDKLKEAFKVKTKSKAAEVSKSFENMIQQLDAIKNDENRNQIEEIQAIIRNSEIK